AVGQKKRRALDRFPLVETNDSPTAFIAGSGHSSIDNHRTVRTFGAGHDINRMEPMILDVGVLVRWRQWFFRPRHQIKGSAVQIDHRGADDADLDDKRRAVPLPRT